MAFAALETGRDASELNGLSLKKNPLMASIIDGCETLKALLAKGRLEPAAVAAAKGLILMRTDKIGFGISVTQGYGLAVSRQLGAPSGWSAPLPLKVDGFSMGAVMGYSEQHTLLLLTTDDEINAFLNDKRTMKVGVDFGLSVGKKLNENRSVDAQQALKQAAKRGSGLVGGGGSSKNSAGGGGGDEEAPRAFTISKGYIVDVSLKGTSVEPDADDMEAAYGEGTTPADVLQGRVRAPPQAQLLYNALAALTAGVGTAGV